MANVLRVKRNAWNATSSSANKPVADALTYGELAWNNIDNTLYIGKQMNATPLINSYRVIPDATASVIGAASFSSTNFVVNSGAVQIADDGIYTEELRDDVVTSAKLNSTNGAEAVTNDVIRDNAVALTTQTTGNYVAAVAGTANEVDISGSAGEGVTFTVGLPQDVTISRNLVVTGDLDVNGTTTTIDSVNVSIKDKNMVLANNISASSHTDSGVNGAGITIGTNADAPTLTWSNAGSTATDHFVFNKPVKLTIADANDVGSNLDFGTYTNP